MMEKILLLGGKEYELIPNANSENQLTEEDPYVFAEGASCKVYRAIDPDNHRCVLIKAYNPKFKAQPAISNKRITQAINAYKSAGGAYILHDFPELKTSDKGIVCQIFDDIGVDLTKAISNVTPNFNSLSETLDLFVDFLKGFQAMHDNNMLHLDIKLENLVIVTPNSPEGKAFIQPIDFASSMAVDEIIDGRLPYTSSTHEWYHKKDIEQLQDMSSAELRRLCFTLDTTACAKVLFFQITGVSQSFPAIRAQIDLVLKNTLNLKEEMYGTHTALVDFFQKAFGPIPNRFLSCNEMIADLQPIVNAINKNIDTVKTAKIFLLNKNYELFQKYEAIDPLLLPSFSPNDNIQILSLLKNFPFNNWFNQNVLIFGPCASGKSTSLLYAYFEYLQSNDTDRLYIYHSLRNKTLGDIEEILKNPFGIQHNMPQKEIEEKQKLILLLDGLDESFCGGTSENIAAFFEKLQEYRSGYHYHYVVTCRHDEKYGRSFSVPSPWYCRYDCQPLSEAQQTLFLDKNPEIKNVISKVTNEFFGKDTAILCFVLLQIPKDKLKSLSTMADMIQCYLWTLFEKRKQKYYKFSETHFWEAHSKIVEWAALHTEIPQKICNTLEMQYYFEIVSPIVYLAKIPNKQFLYFQHKMFREYYVACYLNEMATHFSKNGPFEKNRLICKMNSVYMTSSCMLSAMLFKNRCQGKANVNALFRYMSRKRKFLILCVCVIVCITAVIVPPITLRLLNGNFLLQALLESLLLLGLYISVYFAINILPIFGTCSKRRSSMVIDILEHPLNTHTELIKMLYSATIYLPENNINVFGCLSKKEQLEIKKKNERNREDHED